MNRNIRLLAIGTALALLSVTGVASAAIAPAKPLVGMIFTKDDPKAAEKALEELSTQLGDMSGLLTKSKEDMEKQYKDLSNHFNGVKDDNVELRKTVEKHVADYAEQVKMFQAVEKAVDSLKKELDSPIFKGGKTLEDSDRRAAIELQKRAHLFKGGSIDDFKEDTANLVNVKDYRSAVDKMVRLGGLKTKEEVIRSFTESERKAFDAASLDSAFFWIAPSSAPSSWTCTARLTSASRRSCSRTCWTTVRSAPTTAMPSAMPKLAPKATSFTKTARPSTSAACSA
jgi:hypothetical protein